MTTEPNNAYRTINLNIRLNADEHSALAARASQALIPLSTFARQTLLGTPLVVRSHRSFAAGDIGQVKRLGNLLNQIARAYWRGRFRASTEDALQEVLAEMKPLLRALIAQMADT